LFASGRRTVTTWLRAAGVSDDFQDYYYFLTRVGCKSKSIATQLVALLLCSLPLPKRLLLVIDDSPTKRYGRHVEGADVHHNPTPGPADQPFACTVYGEAMTKIYKTFLATYRPVGGVIRVVLVKEEHGWYAFFSTDPMVSVKDILEALADRATIEQDFHDVKEVCGAAANSKCGTSGTIWPCTI